MRGSNGKTNRLMTKRVATTAEEPQGSIRKDFRPAVELGGEEKRKAMRKVTGPMKGCEQGGGGGRRGKKRGTKI